MYFRPCACMSCACACTSPIAMSAPKATFPSAVWDEIVRSLSRNIAKPIAIADIACPKPHSEPVCVPVRVKTLVHTLYRRVCMNTCKRAHTHAHTRARAHTHTHTHGYAHARTRAHKHTHTDLSSRHQLLPHTPWEKCGKMIRPRHRVQSASKRAADDDGLAHEPDDRIDKHGGRLDAVPWGGVLVSAHARTLARSDTHTRVRVCACISMYVHTHTHTHRLMFE